MTMSECNTGNYNMYYFNFVEKLDNKRNLLMVINTVKMKKTLLTFVILYSRCIGVKGFIKSLKVGCLTEVDAQSYKFLQISSNISLLFLSPLT